MKVIAERAMRDVSRVDAHFRIIETKSDSVIDRDD